MAGLVAAAKNSMLDNLGTLAAFASLHTADPGTTGTNEVTGGSPAYARKALSWAAAATSSKASNAGLTFDVPGLTTTAGTVTGRATRLGVTAGSSTTGGTATGVAARSGSTGGTSTCTGSIAGVGDGAEPPVGPTSSAGGVFGWIGRPQPKVSIQPRPVLPQVAFGRVRGGTRSTGEVVGRQGWTASPIVSVLLPSGAVVGYAGWSGTVDGGTASSATARGATTYAGSVVGITSSAGSSAGISRLTEPSYDGRRRTEDELLLIGAL